MARYDSDDLLVYQTGDDYMPLVYMTRDYAGVFVVELNHWGGTRVRQVIDRTEIKGLAARFGVGDILRAIHQQT